MVEAQIVEQRQAPVLDFMQVERRYFTPRDWLYAIVAAVRKGEAQLANGEPPLLTFVRGGMQHRLLVDTSLFCPTL